MCCASSTRSTPVGGHRARRRRQHESGGEPFHPYLVIRGRATIEPGGALDVMDRLAEFYIGAGQKFPMRDAPPGFTVQVAVDEVYGVGPWSQADGGSEGTDQT
ncbi:MAG: hypothetical protein WEE66_10630 [Actinomycetota bacterium]